MEKRKKRAATALVGILSAACLTTGVAEIAVSSYTDNSSVKYVQTAFAAESYTTATFVAEIKAVAQKVDSYTTDDEFVADLDLAAEAYGIDLDTTMNLVGKPEFEVAKAEQITGLTNYQTVGEIYQKLQDVYSKYYTYTSSVRDLVVVENVTVATIKSKTLLYKDKEANLAKLEAFDSYTAEEQALVKKLLESQGIVDYNTNPSQTFEAIDSVVTAYYTDLTQRVTTAKDSADNIYKNSEGKIVLGSEDKTYANSQSKKSIGEARADYDAIYTDSSIVITEDEAEIYAIKLVIEQAEADLVAVKNSIKKVNDDIVAILVEYDANNKCVTYVLEEKNQIVLANETYEALPETEDNKQKTYFDANYSQTKSDLQTAYQRYLDILALIEEVKVEIDGVKDFTEVTLFTGADRQAVEAARNSFTTKLPAEITSLTDNAEIIKYVTNYQTLLDKEAIIKALDDEMTELKSSIENLKVLYENGGLTNKVFTDLDDAIGKLTEQQYDEIYTAFCSSGRVYYSEIAYYRTEYSHIWNIIKPVVEAISALPEAGDVALQHTDAINSAKSAYDALDATAQKYVDTTKLDAAIQALSVVTAELDAWVAKVNALPTVDKMTVNDKDAILLVHNIYMGNENETEYKFSANTRHYIEELADKNTSSYYLAYTKYDTVYKAMYNETDGLFTRITAVINAMDAIPTIGENPDSTAVNVYVTAYQTAKGLYQAFSDDVSSSLYIQTDKAELGKNQPYAKYLLAGIKSGAYAIEDKINTLNQTLGGSAFDITNSTFTKGTVPVVEETMNGVVSLYNETAKYLEDNSGATIRNKAIIDDLNGQVSAIIEKYQTIANNIVNALVGSAENPVDIKSIELTGGNFAEGQYSIENVLAYLNGLGDNEKTWLKSKHGIDNAYVTAVQTKINDNLNAVKADIASIVENSSNGVLTPENAINMAKYIKEYDENVYSATQKEQLEESITALRSVQGKLDLVEYIKDSIASLTSSALTKEGYESAKILQTLIATQTAEIKGLIGLDNIAKLETKISEYDAENALSVTQVKNSLDKAISDLNTALSNKASSEELSTAIANLTEAYKLADSTLKTTIGEEMNTAISGLKTSLETADAKLQEAIDKVQENLDKAVVELNKAIDTKASSEELKKAVSELTAALQAGKSALDAIIDATEQSLTEEINILREELKTADAKLQALIDGVLAQLTAKDAEINDSLESAKTQLTAITIVFSILLATALACIVVLFVKKK